MVADEAQWAARAAAAEGAADKIEKALAGVQNTLGSNYFGNGCAEGQALYDDLTGVLGSWARELTNQAADLRVLADSCRRASGTYIQVDTEEARGIAT